MENVTIKTTQYLLWTIPLMQEFKESEDIITQIVTMQYTEKTNTFGANI